MKLGLIIEITSQGAGSAAKTYNLTPALEKYASASRSFIKEVFPAREELKAKGMDPLTSLDESARSVVFLRFLGPEGYLVCVFQARPENSGRPYDGAAAWIHVPSSVMLTGLETEQIIDEVTAALSDPLRINYEILDVLFAKEYEQKNVISALAAIGSNGPNAGIRYYGVGTDFQLSELLGNNIAQQVYGNYNAVFLLRKNDGIAVSAPEIIAPLTPTCIMAAPSPIAGYNAFFENGTPFNIDLEYPVNTPLTIVWKKNGYQDVYKKALAKEGNSNDLFVLNKSDVKVAIKKQFFNIIGGGRYLTKYNILIDGVNLDTVLYIPEDKLAKGVRVTVSADGFRTYNKNHMLSADTQRVDIELKKQSFIYKFSIPMYIDGERIDDGLISVELNQKLKECPIEGYSFMSDHIHEGEGNINRLERLSFKEAIKHFAYGFLTCVGIILAVCLYNIIQDIDHVRFKLGWPPIEFVMHSTDGFSDSYTDETNTDETNIDNNDGSTQTDPIDNYSPEKAIAYLNSKSTWCRDSIAKYPSLRGLFDALNEYKFDEIVDTWSKNLKDVPNFKRVILAAEDAKNAPWDPRQGDHSPNYNRENDNMINLEKYTKWISTDHTPKPEVDKPQPAANHIKPAKPPVAKPAPSPAKHTAPAGKDKKYKRGNNPELVK